MAEDYRGTRIFLAAVSALLAIGGLVMIFSGKQLLMRMFLRPPAEEVSTLMLFMTKEFGGVMLLLLSALLWFAARDPVRNAAIMDAFIIGFCVLAVTPLISRAMLPIREIYPDSLVWGRSVIRLILAGVFYRLRPKGAARVAHGASD